MGEHNHVVSVRLCASALALAVRLLRPVSSSLFVCKLWQGAEQQRLELALRTHFGRVFIAKPPASRSDSSEIYYIARDFIHRDQQLSSLLTTFTIRSIDKF